MHSSIRHRGHDPTCILSSGVPIAWCAGLGCQVSGRCEESALALEQPQKMAACRTLPLTMLHDEAHDVQVPWGAQQVTDSTRVTDTNPQTLLCAYSIYAHPPCADPVSGLLLACAQVTVIGPARQHADQPICKTGCTKRGRLRVSCT